MASRQVISIRLMRAALLLCALCLRVWHASAEPPSDELMNATTLEEFLSIAQQYLNETSSSNPATDTSKPLLADSFGGEPGFYHSVASGDPLPDAVIVWTRYTPINESDQVTIELRIAIVEDDSVLPPESLLDPDANANLKRATIVVTAEHDWIAKVDVTNLPSDTHFVFCFVQGDKVSDIGQTRTAPPLDDASVESLTYAVFSCSHFANGYFHAYDVASTIKDLDFWVHVGDYLYEYGLYSAYASDSKERKEQIQPAWETIDLQDHRLRHATYLRDEGLRNLRRRAPMVATWDDHDTADNSYGQGSVQNTGAKNHQMTCPVNATASLLEKNLAGCDRDEGIVSERWNAAFQAYMEWLPLRPGSGSMGVVEDASLTQVIEWGNLATLVVFDTRISHRSREPTVGNHFVPFASLAFANRNVSEYSESPLREEFAAIADSVRNEIYNASYTMIGDNINILRDTFQASREAGKTWQIWGGGTMVGPQLAVNLDRAHEWVEDPTTSVLVKSYMESLLLRPISAFFRILVAMDQNQVPWNSDDFNGFGVERAAILDVIRENANNGIILGGDLHDSFAWTLYEDGNFTGTPVAVNLGITGVTSPGWGPWLAAFLQGLEDVLGGQDGVYKLLSDMNEGQNPGNVYADLQYKGFYTVRATKETHTAEYFFMTPETILSNFDDARAASGRITADFFCGTSLVTTAGEPGSLAEQDGCSAIEFEMTRPTVWNIVVPTSSSSSSDAIASSPLTDCGMGACRSEFPDVQSNDTDTSLSSMNRLSWMNAALVCVVTAMALRK